MSLHFCGYPVPRSTLSPFGLGLSYCSTWGSPAEMEKRQLRVKVGQKHLLWGIFGLSGSSSWGPAGIRAVGPESERVTGTPGLSPAVVLVFRRRISCLSNHLFILPPLPPSRPPTLTHSSPPPSIHTSHLPFIHPFHPNIPPSISPSNPRTQPPNDSFVNMYSMQHHGISGGYAGKTGG